MPLPRKHRKVIFLTIILLVAIGLVWAALFRKKEPVITVQTENVKRRSLTEVVVANGKIQPVLQVKISPEVSGEIIELPVKKGQPVKIGISDDSYWEITDGLAEGQEVVAGGYKAISRDLQDGKKIRKGPAADMEPKT